mmetsp:Transcript_6423/g.14296  ORF Transcript_6423/g.14296 Transcript_6423/m.14296 type:complete len:222 (+) Transcript_6423:133-798(+)
MAWVQYGVCTGCMPGPLHKHAMGQPSVQHSASVEGYAEDVLGQPLDLLGLPADMLCKKRTDLLVRLVVQARRPRLVNAAWLQRVVLLGELVELLAGRLLALKLLQPVADAFVCNVEELLDLEVFRSHLDKTLRESFLVGLGERLGALVEQHVELARPILPRRPPLPLDPLALIRDRGRDHEHPAVGVRLAVHDLEVVAATPEAVGHCDAAAVVVDAAQPLG